MASDSLYNYDIMSATHRPQNETGSCSIIPAPTVFGVVFLSRGHLKRGIGGVQGYMVQRACSDCFGF